MTRNGWTGADPLVRVLRAFSILAFVALLAVILVDKSRDSAVVDALLVGGILLQLGYDVVLRLPDVSISRRDRNADAPGTGEQQREDKG